MGGRGLRGGSAGTGVGVAVVPASLDPAGPAAEDIATLWWVLLAVGTVVFGIVLVALVVPMLRRRWRGGGDESADRTEVPATTSTRWIVGLGVVLTTILLIGVLVVTVATVRSISRAAPAEATRIDVIGYQYWWAATYPDHGVTVANELHVPVDEPVELHLTSADVIHSFWVPELHGKLDLLPDGTNRLVIEADEPGVYGGECAEFCGLQHANMGFLVVAQPPGRVRGLGGGAAAARPPTPATAAGTRGRDVFLDEGCGSCHMIARREHRRARTPAPT